MLQVCCTHVHMHTSTRYVVSLRIMEVGEEVKVVKGFWLTALIHKRITGGLDWLCLYKTRLDCRMVSLEETRMVVILQCNISWRVIHTYNGNLILKIKVSLLIEFTFCYRFFHSEQTTGFKSYAQHMLARCIFAATSTVALHNKCTYSNIENHVCTHSHTNTHTQSVGHIFLPKEDTKHPWQPINCSQTQVHTQA